LPSRRRNDLEKLLSIFDQENRLSDEHILNVKEEDFPKEYREIIRRLQKAHETPEIVEQMTVEDEILEEFRIRERILAQKDEVIAKKDEVIAEAKEILVEKDKVISEKDKVISGKDKVISETQKALAEQAKRIAELERLLTKKE
jgi:uncharacterized protein (DUF3084 family)